MDPSLKADVSPSLFNTNKQKHVARRGITIRPCLYKYWRQCYSLFSRYDVGILMDEEGWFSVTPEAIADSHAAHVAAFGASVIINCFTGVGGNAIQFAFKNFHVIAFEIDPRKVEYAVNNARIYGVVDRFDFIVGDFFHLTAFLKGDVVFLSPPWGGPSYSKFQTFTLDMLRPIDGYSIFQAAQQITPNVIMFLPRNVDLNQVEQLSWLSCPPLKLKIEENHIKDKLKGITACYGNIALE